MQNESESRNKLHNPGSQDKVGGQNPQNKKKEQAQNKAKNTNQF
ncbi:hypothetical protein [Flavonifractor hominis]|uniref:Uncharacterized protein n=1 Tax=Flavonifractor hominis TaxID=3133178 RepID=A0ABV1EK04_9FIRM